MVVLLVMVLEWFPVAFPDTMSEQCPEVSVDLQLTFQRFFRNTR